MKHVPLEDRFWSKADCRGPDECWVWTGNKDKFGYGRIQVGRRPRKANRVAWQLANGIPAPVGKSVCHSCDNPGCVNPAHLWIGTQQDNMRDASAKGRIPQSQRTHCKQGHPYSPENTRVQANGWRKCLQCSRAWARKHYALHGRKERVKCL